ncbi:MAG: hypothetical protein KGJ02_05615 [Verrucomicrobiota bacterium]|nr:hypothetical protein [Verrucomicrobiota bacterium]
MQRFAASALSVFSVVQYLWVVNFLASSTKSYHTREKVSHEAREKSTTETTENTEAAKRGKKKGEWFFFGIK